MRRGDRADECQRDGKARLSDEHKEHRAAAKQRGADGKDAENIVGISAPSAAEQRGADAPHAALPALRQQERHGQQQRQRRQGDKRPAQGAAIRIAQCRQRRQRRHQRHAVPPAGIGDVGFQRERAAEDGNRAANRQREQQPFEPAMLFLPKQRDHAGQAEHRQIRGGGSPARRVAVIGVDDVALNRHEQRADALEQRAEGIGLRQQRRVARARPRDGEHEEHRGAEQHARQCAADAAFKDQREHVFPCAAGLPIRAEKPKDEVQRRQQRAGEHEIVIRQRVQPAEERQQAAPGTLAHRVLHPQQDQREERDDLREMIKLRIDDGEAGEGVEHAAQQGEPLVADHPPQVAKRGQRADGVLEHRHHADAKRNQRFGQKRQRPDEHAAQRIKRIAADGRRAEEGVEAVTVQPAAQNPPRFQNEGKLLLDEVAPCDKAPAVGQNGRSEGEESQQRAQKKCVRTGDAPPLKRRSLHPCSSLEIGGLSR